MTNKAYIVANEQQEREVLEKLEEKGALWGTGKNATDFIPFRTFPYVIYCNGDKYISWDNLGDLDVNKIIVFDGRKEEQMSEKYVVSQDFMDKLEDWKETLMLDNVLFIGRKALSNLPNLLDKWWRDGSVSVHESNNRLIAIIRWVNGEDVFEVEKPKKWVVRSKECNEQGNYLYIYLIDSNGVKDVMTGWTKDIATKFDTKEEAQEWANSHQEVVGV